VDKTILLVQQTCLLYLTRRYVSTDHVFITGAGKETLMVGESLDKQGLFTHHL